VIEWSYEHLATNEQQVLRRLAVFAGGWTLAAATAVAGDSDNELAMVEMLGYLVDKSLVVVDRESSKEPRYRMLETVRQYAQERLDESGHGAAVRTRHLAYYCGLAEGAQSELLSDRGYPSLARLDADLTNLLAAHAWCESAPNGAEIALRLLTALTNYFHQRGLVGLARQALEEALRRDGASRESLASARALFAAGDLAARHHDFPRARRYLEDYLRIAPVVGDQAKMAMATALLGSIGTAGGEYARAQQLLETALALARENQDHFAEAFALNCLGELCRIMGDVELARQAYEQAIAICYEHGLVRVGTLLNLAIVAIEQGRYNPARDRIAEAASFIQGIENQFHAARVLDLAGALAAATQDHAAAARMRGAADAIHEKSGASREAADQQFLDPLLKAVTTALVETAHREAYDAGHALTFEEAIAELRAWVDNREGADSPTP
jgi:tetratricopeptide (TPR) repeat protein